MVLIQLLLPTSGAASADGLAPLAETRRVVTETFDRASWQRMRPRWPSVLDKKPFMFEPCPWTCSMREIDG